MPTVVDGVPAAVVYTEDNCEGQTSVFTFETDTCEGESLDNDIYTQFKFQYNSGKLVDSNANKDVPAVPVVPVSKSAKSSK